MLQRTSFECDSGCNIRVKIRYGVVKVCIKYVATKLDDFFLITEGNCVIFWVGGAGWYL